MDVTSTITNPPRTAKTEGGGADVSDTQSWVDSSHQLASHQLASLRDQVDASLMLCSLREASTYCNTPPPPEDPLDEYTLAQLQIQYQTLHAMKERRFTMTDITQNLEIHKAARKELDPTCRSAPQLEGIGVSGLFGKVYELELCRQGAAVAAIDKDVAEESAVNAEVVELVMERLESSRKTLDGFHKMLVGLACAEHAYSSAMLSAFKTATPADSEGHNLEEALASISCFPNVVGQAHCELHTIIRFPNVVGQAHRELHAIMSALANSCSQLQSCYKSFSSEVVSEASQLKRDIESGRNSLLSAFSDHAVACNLFDTVLADRARGRMMHGPVLDPWTSEGKLSHKSLKKFQDLERAFIKRSYHHSKELEVQRLDLYKQAAAVISDSYRASMVPIQAELDTMENEASEAQPPTPTTVPVWATRSSGTQAAH
eukprot:gene13968-19910_t